MKILFWFNGSGGQRRERSVREYPTPLEPEVIESDLDDWRYGLRSNSEYQRWGWDDKFDEKTLEPRPEIT
jgi:hypothetical protein